MIDFDISFTFSIALLSSGTNSIGFETFQKNSAKAFELFFADLTDSVYKKQSVCKAIPPVNDLIWLSVWLSIVTYPDILANSSLKTIIS